VAENDEFEIAGDDHVLEKDALLRVKPVDLSEMPLTTHGRSKARKFADDLAGQTVHDPTALDLEEEHVTWTMADWVNLGLGAGGLAVAAGVCFVLYGHWRQVQKEVAQEEDAKRKAAARARVASENLEGGDVLDMSEK